MKHDKYGLYIVIFVAIVGLVAAVMISGTVSGDLTGQAFKGFAKQQQYYPMACSETDGGDDPYTMGWHTGTYPWGFNVTGGVPDKCRLMNNQPTDSCSNCKLMEYYCRQDGFLFWNFYTGVDCEDGAIVQQTCTPAPATAHELEDYPGMFDTDYDGVFDGILVVGDNAPAEDAITITNIAMALEDDGLNVSNAVKLDTEVIDFCQNMIVVGEVCENSVLQEILGYSQANCNDAYVDLVVDTDEGYIGLFESPQGYVYLIVIGEDAMIRMKTGNVVSEHTHPFFTGQSMIYTMCDYMAVYIAVEQENLDDLLEDLDDAIDDLDDQTTMFTLDLLDIITALDGIGYDLADAETEILARDFIDAEDHLQDIVDDFDDALEDFEDLIDDIDYEGYDTEDFSDIDDELDDLLDFIDDTRDYLALNCP